MSNALPASPEPAAVSFCDICDRPLPVAMLSDDVCAPCWEAHADDLWLNESQGLALWAMAHAKAARGPLLLVGETECPSCDGLGFTERDVPGSDWEHTTVETPCRECKDVDYDGEY